MKACSSPQTANNYAQSQNKAVTNDSVIDISLNNEVLKQLGYMDKNDISSILNIPSTYNTYSGITYRVIKIDDNVFKDCYKLQTITIPDTVTEIGNSSFEGCKFLEKINIPVNVAKIGDRAFANCTSLKNINIPESVIKIGKSVFTGCSSLISVHIPSKVTKISEGLFSLCKLLNNIIIPNGVTEIGNLSFGGCESLNNIFIPETVIKIGDRAFVNCKALENIIIPNSVVNIGKEVFGGCVKLQRFALSTKFTIFKDDISKQIDLELPISVSFPVSLDKNVNFINLFKNANKGDYVKFGKYPQSSIGDVVPIEWRVLTKENNQILLISRYGLEARRFDSISNNWKNSEIRNWLNNEFYNKAFSEEEKKNIISFEGNNVFLLSREESEKYFVRDEDRRCKATDYVVTNDISNGYVCWWLRSSNVFNNYSVYNVDINGAVNYYGVCGSIGVVRPALWVTF